MLYLLTDQISLSDYLYFVCLPGCYVINFEINFIFLIKSFFQKLRKKFKYREDKKSFKVKWKAFFYHFQKSFQLRKVRPESAPLMR